MEQLNLPSDFLDFVRSGKQLQFDKSECEAGPIELRAPDELKLERVPVEVYQKSFSAENPHLGETGFYYPLVVPLTKGDYVTYAVLLWLPQEQVFATYNDDHHDLLLFSGVMWADIVAEPLLYLNAHWEVEPDSDLVAEFKPWPKHPFREGERLTEVGNNCKV